MKDVNSKMTKKNNNITIALGILCIILAAGLIAVVANYSGKPDTSALESQVNDLQEQVNSLTDVISDYEEQIDELTDENNYYASIIALDEYIVLIGDITYTQDTNDETILYNEELHYAGYIEINTESTSDTTYIQVSYTYNDLKFDQTVTVGNKGTAYFPVLPGTIKIILGNSDTNIDTETIDTTITLTYTY
jgi:vacuolar-type H+-ATPase subunit I/STV1